MTFKEFLLKDQYIPINFIKWSNYEVSGSDDKNDVGRSNLSADDRIRPPEPLDKKRKGPEAIFKMKKH